MSAASGSFDDPPWTGPWADDARRLFQVIHTTVEQVAEQLAEPVDPAAERSDHPPECRYCPICRGVALVRQAGPDVLDQVSELAAGLAAALRAASASAAAGPAGDGSGGPAEPPGDGSSAPSPDRPGGTRTGGPARPPSTVRIDVTD